MFGYQNVRIPGVLAFHQSGATIRLLSANNRGGKSTRGAWELVTFATGYNPIRKQYYPTPNICWAVALDNKNYGHIIEDRLREWLPAGTRWEEGKRRFILPAPWKSIIYLKSAEPGETKFAAEGILAAWFDEGREAMEKPFAETLARLKPGWPLHVFMTMTPEDGSGGWTWRKFYDPESKDRYPGAEIFYFNMYDCSTDRGGHITPQEISDFKDRIPWYKQEAKMFGRPGSMASDPYFRPDQIKKAQARSKMPRRGSLNTDAQGQVRFKEDEEGDIYLMRDPVPGRPYIMPIDVAGGVNRDYTIASILDPIDKEECAYFKSNELDPQFATLRRIIPLGKFFNTALAQPETNGEHGGICITVLREAKYSKIYRHRGHANVHRKIAPIYGWKTVGDSSRNMIYDAWQKALREDEWTFSRDVLSEVGIVSELEGRPDHPKGRNDDHFIAVGIGLATLELKPALARTFRQPQQPVWIGEDAQYAI
jgi:hypothetical protein